MTNPTNREQARAIIGNVNNYAEESTGELSISAFGPLAQRIAAALSSRDAEVRKILSGFIHAGVEFDDERMNYVVMQIDRRDLEKGRELYAKLQPGKEGEDVDKQTD